MSTLKRASRRMAQHHVKGGEDRQGLMPERPFPGRTEPQQQERRRGAEADGVAQAVELRAELAGGARQAGHVAVQRVEDHGGDDQPAGQCQEELVGVSLVGLADFTEVGNSGKTADRVSQGEQRRQDGDFLHGRGSPRCQPKLVHIT